MPPCCFSASTQHAYRDVVTVLNKRYNRLMARIRCNDTKRRVIPGEFLARVGQAHAMFEECVAEICYNDEDNDDLDFLIESVQRTEIALSAELDAILTCKLKEGTTSGVSVDDTRTATDVSKDLQFPGNKKEWVAIVPRSESTETASSDTADDPLHVTNKSELASCIGEWITRLATAPSDHATCNEADQPNLVTVFHSKTVPSISVVRYFERVNKYARVSRGVLVAAMIYMERAVNACYNLHLTKHTAHRLLITVVAVSAKVHEDVHYGLSVFAQIGGISKQELIRLENTLLELLCYDMFISSIEYQVAAAAFAALCGE